jgi:hypothetical protein
MKIMLLGHRSRRHVPAPIRFDTRGMSRRRILFVRRHDRRRFRRQALESRSLGHCDR